MILVKDAIINGKKQDLLVEGNIIKKLEIFQFQKFQKTKPK